MSVTKIEWTDRTSNPLRAYVDDKRGWFCVRHSPGCGNCYASAMNRWVGNGLDYAAQNLKRVRFEMDPGELRSWQRLKAGTKVFAFSMTDLFQDGVTDSVIDLAMGAIGTSPATFQVLTKRAGRMLHYMRDWYRRTQVQLLPNLWLGVSVEDQAFADQRIPLLLQTPAAVRFVSYEPALGPVDFRPEWIRPQRGCGGLHRGPCGLGLHHHHDELCGPRLDQVIVGGESGPGARPFDVAWARSTVQQCKAAAVAVFVKQMGRWVIGDHAGFAVNHWLLEDTDGNRRGFVPPMMGSLRGNRPDNAVGFSLWDSKGGEMDEWPEDLRVREFPTGGGLN